MRILQFQRGRALHRVARGGVPAEETRTPLNPIIGKTNCAAIICNDPGYPSQPQDEMDVIYAFFA